jgi:D-alanine-D-alanine ligase
MKHIAIFCGGDSYEHDVSIITGIQVAENIDRTKFTYSFVYVDKTNTFFVLKNCTGKKNFLKAKRIKVDLIRRDTGVYLAPIYRFHTKIKIDAAYLAFHGGSGESGPFQGMLQLLCIPFTSAQQEGSVIAMNKSLTKEVLKANGIPVLPSVSIFASEYVLHTQNTLAQIQSDFAFPVILKPVHLGSSIGISIAKNAVELEKFLNIATRLDTEMLIEPALSDFTEYNVSVRSTAHGVECSPIEEPKREHEILTFSDKYENGSKKGGGKRAGGGMELLDRTIPAKIDNELAHTIINYAKTIYTVTRLAGLVRIDFMFHKGKLFCTEVNPIPGSMAFYLWEAKGEQFKDQITQSIEDAVLRFSKKIEI